LDIDQSVQLIDAKVEKDQFLVLLLSKVGTYEVHKISRDGQSSERIRSTLFEEFSTFKEFPNLLWGAKAWQLAESVAIMPFLHQVDGPNRNKNFGYSQFGTSIGVANAKAQSWAVLTDFKDGKCTFKVTFGRETKNIVVERPPDWIFQDHMGTYFQYPDGIEFIDRTTLLREFWTGRLLCGSLD
jgi:hypothetical protein